MNHSCTRSSPGSPPAASTPAVALALVMIYQATHLVNFAQGEMAMFSTYIAWALIKAGVPYWVAFVARRSRSRSSGGVVDRARHHPPRRERAGPLGGHRVHRRCSSSSTASPAGSSPTRSRRFPSPFPAEPLFGIAYLSSHELGIDRRHADRAPARCSSSSASPRSAWRCARRRENPVVEPAGRHPRRLDARARLGPGGGDRRRRRDDGRADRLPRAEHDVRRPALRASPPRCSAASTTPGGAVLGGFIVGVLENLVGAYVVGTELKLDGRAGDHRRRAGRQAVGPVRQGHGGDARMMRHRRKPHRPSPLLAIAARCRFSFANYHVFQLTLIVVYAIALLGLNMLTGYNGQISLGHGAFYAIGAYTAAILMDKAGCRTGLTIPIAGGGLLRRRLPVRPAGAAARGPLPRARDLRARRGDAADPEVQAHRAMDRRRAGHRHRQARRAVRAAARRRPLALFLHPCRRSGALLGGWNLLRGRIGRALVAIRDHPIAAAAMGVNTARYKSLTFGVCAMYTGVAGALGAIRGVRRARQLHRAACRSIFSSASSSAASASISGAVFGAAFILFVPNVADQISKARPGRSTAWS